MRAAFRQAPAVVLVLAAVAWKAESGPVNAEESTPNKNGKMRRFDG